MHLHILGTRSRGRLSEPTFWLRIMGKAICFHKTGPKIMPKRINNTISMIFPSCTYKRQDGQNWYSFLNLFLEPAACAIPHANNIFIKPKMLALR